MITEIENGIIVKKITSCIAALVNDGELVAKKDGLHIVAIDDSRVALVDIFFSSGNTERYDAPEDESIKISFYDFNRFADRIRKDDKVYMETFQDTNKLLFRINSKSLTRKFKLSMLEEVSPSIDYNELACTAKISMESSDFAKMMKDMNSIGDKALFTVTKEGDFIITVEGKTNMRIDTNEKSKNVTDSEITSIYSLPFLFRMCNAAATLSKDVSIEYSTDNPIVIEFKIDDNESNGYCRYVLSPQVEESDVPEDDSTEDEAPKSNK
jgi:proliferating cell nuclear antigen